MEFCGYHYFNKICTCKDILTQVDATRSLADATTGNVKNPVKDIWMTIVETNPEQPKKQVSDIGNEY